MIKLYRTIEGAIERSEAQQVEVEFDRVLDINLATAKQVLSFRAYERNYFYLQIADLKASIAAMLYECNENSSDDKKNLAALSEMLRQTTQLVRKASVIAEELLPNRKDNIHGDSIPSFVFRDGQITKKPKFNLVFEGNTVDTGLVMARVAWAISKHMHESGKNIETIAEAFYDPTIPKASGRYIISSQAFESLQQSDRKRYTPLKTGDTDSIYVWNNFSMFINNNSTGTKIEGNMIKLIKAMKMKGYTITEILS